jgi:hypothetical protein
MKVDPRSSSGRGGDELVAETIDWAQLEQLIRRDPGGRGVASYSHEGAPLLPRHLRAAAEDLAANARAVAIVTGFAIVTPEGVAAETDGPPGALYLARTLRALGVDVVVLSDVYGTQVLNVGCDAWGMPRSIVEEIPFEHVDSDHPSRLSNDPPHHVLTDAWVNDFLTSAFGRRLTHVIAIERVGPSHALESVRWAMPAKSGNEVESLGESLGRASDPLRGSGHLVGSAHPTDFAAAVPPEHRNVCHNMRGESINRYTAKAHRLFEIIAERRLPVATVGIGDGGNEIGMGSIPWHVLRPAIAKGPAERVICRIATTWTIIAGVSNWGGYALALATAALKDRQLLARLPDAAALRHLIETLVRDSFCVDGVTKRREASVDALPLNDYLGVFDSLRTSLAAP